MARSMRWLLFVLLLPGCSCALDPSGFVRDGGRPADVDAATLDAGPRRDAGPRPDGGRERDGGGSDGGGLPTLHGQLRYGQLHAPDGSLLVRTLVGYFSDGSYDDGCVTVRESGACRVMSCGAASGAADAGTLSVEGLGTAIFVTAPYTPAGYDGTATGVPEGLSLSQPFRFLGTGGAIGAFTTEDLSLGAVMRPDLPATISRSVAFEHTWNPGTIGDEIELSIETGSYRARCVAPTSSGELTVPAEILGDLPAGAASFLVRGSRVYERSLGAYTVILRGGGTDWLYPVTLE